MDQTLSARLSPQRVRPSHAGRTRRALRIPFAIARAVAIATGALLIVAMAAATIVPRFVPSYRTFTVLTGSMAPAIPAGSLVVLRPAAAETLRAGDVISFTTPDQSKRLVTHRISEIRQRDGRTVFLTKGDANGHADSWEIPASGAGWRVAFHLPHAGTPMIWLGRPDVKFGISVALVLIISGLLIRRVWRRDDPEESEEPVTAAA